LSSEAEDGLLTAADRHEVCLKSILSPNGFEVGCYYLTVCHPAHELKESVILWRKQRKAFNAFCGLQPRGFGCGRIAAMVSLEKIAALSMTLCGVNAFGFAEPGLNHFTTRVDHDTYQAIEGDEFLKQRFAVFEKR
jgi:hypothetical protein